MSEDSVDLDHLRSQLRACEARVSDFANLQRQITETRQKLSSLVASVDSEVNELTELSGKLWSPIGSDAPAHWIVGLCDGLKRALTDYAAVLVVLLVIAGIGSYLVAEREIGNLEKTAAQISSETISTLQNEWADQVQRYGVARVERLAPGQSIRAPDGVMDNWHVVPFLPEAFEYDKIPTGYLLGLLADSSQNSWTLPDDVGMFFDGEPTPTSQPVNVLLIRKGISTDSSGDR